MTFWNCVSKSCFPRHSISMRYTLGTKLLLYRFLFVCFLVCFLFPETRSMYRKEAKINVSLSWERCKFLGFLVDFRWEHLLGLILVLCRLSLFRKEFLFPFLSHTYALLIRASRGTHRSVWLRKKKMACHSSYPSDSTERKFILVSIETKQ